MLWRANIVIIEKWKRTKSINSFRFNLIIKVLILWFIELKLFYKNFKWINIFSCQSFFWWLSMLRILRWNTIIDFFECVGTISLTLKSFTSRNPIISTHTKANEKLVELRNDILNLFIFLSKLRNECNFPPDPTIKCQLPRGRFNDGSFIFIQYKFQSL